MDRLSAPPQVVCGTIRRGGRTAKEPLRGAVLIVSLTCPVG